MLTLAERAALTESERREYVRLHAGYIGFQKRYQDFPDHFARDCIRWESGEGLKPYQLEILGLVPRYKRVSVRSLHGVGKTTKAALLILWFALTRDGWSDWKVPTTASAWRQLEKFLWPEVHKWARLIRWDVVGRDPFTPAELLTQVLRLSTGEAFAMASDQPALIEGAHASQMLMVFDEAKTIPDPTWDAVEGALSQGGLANKEAMAFCISTPGPPAGRFYDIQRKKDGFENWHTRHITLPEAIAAGQVSPDWADQMRRAWGETSAMYQRRVLGEFASEETDGIIPLSWIEAANDRWLVWRDARIAAGLRDTPVRADFIGVDVARSGVDKNVFAPRIDESDLTVIPYIIRKEQKQDTMQTTGQVAQLMDTIGGVPIVDVLNMGAGVVDRLRELKRIVWPFNASAKTHAKDSSGLLGFVNVRSAAWWGLRERLDPSTKLSPVALPPDDLLTGDLTSVTKREESSGAIAIAKKEDIAKKIHRSPDTGDAVMMVIGAHLVRPPDTATGAPMPELRSSRWRGDTSAVSNPALGSE